MKELLILALGTVFLLGSGGVLSAQPEPAGYTISDVYYYLTEGIVATEGGHSLKPPVSADPGRDVEGFDKSLVDIYYFMADVFGQADLTKTDLAGKGLTGKKYFSTDAENWGVVEMVASPTPVVSPTPAASPTPVVSPTPQPSWYDIYGPRGTGDVIEIEGMYVAMNKDGIGCASDEKKIWTAAVSWGTGLNWLEKTDWVLPSKVRLLTICHNKSRLHSFQEYNYWSSTEYYMSDAYDVEFSVRCEVRHQNKVFAYYVRAVRNCD